ncbi:MAG: hypothetical protein WAP35_06595 [Solirubrobacterales bacterium]
MQGTRRLSTDAIVRIATLSLALLCLALLCTALLLAASASAGKPDAHASAMPGKARLAVDECVGAALYADRRLTFKGSMSTINAGGTMEMRFSLYTRNIGQRRFKRVAADDQNGLEKWLAGSEPSATSYIHNLSVTPVETRIHYRARVQFRWTDASGKVVAKTKRVSKLCKQNRTLPDLVVKGVNRYPTTASDSRPEFPMKYVVEVENRGRTSAYVSGEMVSATLNGAPLANDLVTKPHVLTYDTLPARTSEKLTFFGPQCSGLLDFVIDPLRMARETSERNNHLSLGC